MNDFSCGCKASCKTLSIIAGIILGIIAGILRYTAVITITSAFLWVLFGIAVVYLAILLIVSAQTRSSTVRICMCSLLNLILTGILGTILLSVILLGIEFVATSIIGAILTGLLILAFTLTASGVACLVKCFSNCQDSDD